MKPIQLKHMKRTNVWNPARRVWFQKNDDTHLGSEETIKMKQKQADENITKVLKSDRYERIKKGGKY